MQMTKFFRISAISAALVLAGCGGDIELSSDVDNSVGDTVINNPAPVNPDLGVELPGIPSSSLSAEVSAAVGFDVQVQVVDGQVTEDTTLASSDGSKPVFYAISGGLEIMGGATLTIDKDAVLFGQSGNDYLVVHRDAKIMAEGTKSEPIIFTSLQDVKGEEVSAGQWGGIVILGNAPSNKCPSDGSECALQIEGVGEGAVFGGNNWEDNSGVLKYVVVKFAGYEIAPDNELNGVTFGGVGSGTTVDYLQVHANADDGVEFFGGAVDAKHLVLTGNKDDSIDWDNGFKGRLQHIFVQHAANAGEANRAIEADNDGSTPDKEPMSNPTLSNMTIMGNNFDTADKDSEGIYLREGTSASIYNTVITGPAEMGECLEFEAGQTVTNAESGNIVIQNSTIACNNGENFKNAGDFDLEAWFTGEATNMVSTSILIDEDGVPSSQSPLLGTGQDTSAVDTWFDVTDYQGAFDGATDWREGWAFGFGGGVITEPPEEEGCPTGTSAIAPVNGQTTCEISGTITSDLTLTSNNLYALDGPVFVGNNRADSATLTIEAGTTVFGRSGGDYLVVSRDSKIEALGSAQAPITFTSSQDINGEETGSGQWGGMVLLGNAPSNKCPTLAGGAIDPSCSLQVEGVEEGATFGGDNWEDDSGTLRYVVVKHAGFEVAPDNELNGITFGGVGSATTVEFIQVHENADDGVEFFGGAVNAKYVVLTSNKDDSVDWDNGFRGNMQYVLVKHDENGGESNRAIEADNDGSNPSKDPQSNPTIANMTIIGNSFDTADKDSEGIYLREGTRAQLHNFVVTNAAGECLELETGVTVDQAIANETVITNSVFACNENFKSQDSSTGAFDLMDWVININADNSTEAGIADVINGIYTIDATVPYSFGSHAFFDNADHIGAVSESNDWTAGWTVGLE
ncbi:hypothetical protein [Colwellia polaris]|jgi:hypothetical protein|uniref:hypothetical protein n=1 Tax=Colwellia polaris TaxID=326537 RepID=UPI000A1718D8|nr:hypothetical protein [Colwellia polaris]|tara:strand:- start:1690 stop:4425 length:2736 start_codon:yes stop_codon:yes gene_type:complete